MYKKKKKIKKGGWVQFRCDAIITGKDQCDLLRKGGRGGSKLLWCNLRIPPYRKFDYLLILE